MTMLDDRLLEDRLRDELPELADLLISDGLPARGEGVDPPSRRRRVWPAVAAAVLLVTGVVGVVAVVREDDHASVRTSETPTTTVGEPGFGTWRAMAVAPIPPRAFPVAAWLDGTAVFWAGSNLQRGLAYSDGARYDPATDAWSQMVVPGWGHPGMASAVFDGQLDALAKRGGARFDPATDSWADLPEIEGMYFSAAVATDDAVYGLGPVEGSDGSMLGIARYDAESDRWVRGGSRTMQSPDELVEALEGAVMWTGSEIVVWNHGTRSQAYDPATDVWRDLAALVPPAGHAVDSRAVMTDGGVVALVTVQDLAGELRMLVATEEGGSWNWRDPELPISTFDGLQLVAAGEWIVALRVAAPPVVIYGPTGQWQAADDAPIIAEGASATWTGTQLVIWGGEGDTAARGSVWTPPVGPPSCARPAVPTSMGLVGAAADDVIPLGLRDGYRIGELKTVSISSPQFEDAWRMVSAPVLDRNGNDLGLGIWMHPDDIVVLHAGDATSADLDRWRTDPWLTPDETYLYATNDVARASTVWHDLPPELQPEPDLAAIAAACHPSDGE